MNENIKWELKASILIYKNRIRNFKLLPHTNPKVKKYIQKGINKAEKEIKNLEGRLNETI